MTVERARELLERHSVPPKPASPPVRHCKCGQTLQHGVRHGPESGRRTAVLICWGCGYEEPSLYGRTQAERNGKYDARPRHGRWSYDVDEGTPRWR